ncbi:MAG TPA: sialidase family protein [Phycisphaerae bacterium]|nr:sialidase family protein [Phycisphaerae bacterium]
MTPTTLAALIGVLAAMVATPGATPRHESASDDNIRPVHQTALRIAMSTDGLTFLDQGRTLAVKASAPDLNRLSDGDLLALFDYAIGDEDKGETVMAVSRSKDQGRTWSPMRLLRLRGPDGRRVAGRHGDLVRTDGGHYRLFFTATTPPTTDERQAEAGTATTLFSAATGDGIEYRVDATVRLEQCTLAPGADVHPMAVGIGARLHLFAAEPHAAERGRENAERSVWHVVSADGRRFTEPVPARIPPIDFVGSLVPVGRSVRAYVGIEEGIGSLITPNGRDWELESGVRLADAWDPAVVRLKDGSFLMIYCTDRDKRRAPTQQVEWAAEAAGSGSVASAGGDDVGGADGATEGLTWDEDGNLIGPDGQPIDPADIDAMLAPPGEDELGWLDEDEWSDWWAEEDPLSTEEEWIAEADQEWGGDQDGEVAGDAGTDSVGGSDRELGGEPANDVRTDAGRDASGDVVVADVADNWDGDVEVDTAGDQPDRPDDTLAADVADDPGEALVDDWNTDASAADWPAESPTQDRTANSPVDDGSEFAPSPDFETHIDYFAWFDERIFRELPDNAFDRYAEFMPFGPNGAVSEEDWPEMVDMFSDPTYDGPPGPWSPTDHPEWEESNLAAQEVLLNFREAGFADGYALRPMFGEERMFQTPEDEPLLLEMRLPALSPHRQLAKATLADAWRAPDGEVSPERMLDAFETTLRNADHVGSGPTLIEGLVGTSERALVQKNAMWALQHQVFDERGLEEALDLLVEHDRDDTDPVKWVRGEHAMCMQTVQYMFEPGDSDYPKVRVAETMGQLVADDILNEEAVSQLASMGLDDARTAVDALDTYYGQLLDQWRTGYPEVRAADMNATAEKYRHTNALTETLLPSLGRVQTIRTRNEASRRATQLSYAAHLFKARNGRWPESLAELPEEHGGRMRVDPFTGRHFGYRLTDEGYTLYSASENGVDDGGVHSPRWEDEITNDAGSDDHVFWPPQEPRS